MAVSPDETQTLASSGIGGRRLVRCRRSYADFCFCLNSLFCFLNASKYFHCGKSWSATWGRVVLKRHPIRSSAGDKLHQASGVERYVRRAMYGSLAFLSSLLAVWTVRSACPLL